jgi:hypothetical protein
VEVDQADRFGDIEITWLDAPLDDDMNARELVDDYDG